MRMISEIIHCSMALQRYRIGPNFRIVGVNRPRCPVHSSAEDGPLNVANQTGEINYFPSEFANQVCVHCTWTILVLCSGPTFIKPAAARATESCKSPYSMACLHMEPLLKIRAATDCLFNAV